MRKSILICCAFIFTTAWGHAQHLNISYKETINPKTINAQYYSTLLGSAIDWSNPYTSVYWISMEEQKLWPIVVQFNFSNEPICILVSNEILKSNQCHHTLKMLFEKCMLDIKKQLIPSDLTEDLLGCLIDQLNQCCCQ